jgi:hypothetical protein
MSGTARAAATQRMIGQDGEVLLRQIDGRLDALRSDPDLAAAERVAAALRHLVAVTARASAADLARVRAAVRYFASPGRTRPPSSRYGPLGATWTAGAGWSGWVGGPGRRTDHGSARSIDDDVRVVNEILRDRGRADAWSRPGCGDGLLDPGHGQAAG